MEEKAEKGLSSLRTSGDRFVFWLSQVTSPFVVGLGIFGYVALSTAPQWQTLCGGSRSSVLVCSCHMGLPSRESNRGSGPISTSVAVLNGWLRS